ncbi:hypothetical protein BH09PSE2_BH09PSE2_03350 [soil metagenome]
MPDTLEKHAGAAALTLLDCLLVHMQDAKQLSEADRDAIFESATGAHEAAQDEDGDPAHEAIVTILRRVQTRSDGIKLVGNSTTAPWALREEDQSGSPR